MINVLKESEDKFNVIVKHRGIETEHTVTLDDNYWQKLTGGEIPKEDLIKKSFEFLLERESNRSILRSFNLSIINKYFPEYESEIGVSNS